MMKIINEARAVLLLSILFAACGCSIFKGPREQKQIVASGISDLWGTNGELWNPIGRLPDYSFAGYRSGRGSIPEIAVTANVKDFGAVGDGKTDDTAAFE